MTRKILQPLLLCSLMFVSVGIWNPQPAEAASSDPGVVNPSAEDLVAAGGQHLAKGDPDAAFQAFTRARDQDSTSPLPLLGLADVAHHRGQLLDALALARRAERLISKAGDGNAGDVKDPALQAAIFERLSRWLIRLGAPGEALEALDRWRQITPDQAAPYGLSAMVLRDIDQVPRAVNMLQLAIEQADASPELYEQLGLLLLSDGKAQAALDVANPALESFPEHSGLELVKGLAFAADPERRDQALPFLQRALEHGAPDPGRIHLEIGSIHADGTCQPRAIKSFEQAAELRPDDPQTHYQLGIAHRACGQADAARTALAKFQQLSSADDTADHQRKQVGAALNDAQRLAADGRLDDALAALDSIAKTNSDDDRVFTLRAKVLLSANRLDAALKDAQRARTLMPSRVEAHYLEGLALAQAGQLADAQAPLRNALAINEARAEVHQLLAAVVAEAGRPEDAVKHFERAIELGSDTPSVHLAFARVLESLGRNQESAAHMDRFRELTGRAADRNGEPSGSAHIDD